MGLSVESEFHKRKSAVGYPKSALQCPGDISLEFKLSYDLTGNWIEYSEPISTGCQSVPLIKEVNFSDRGALKKVVNRLDEQPVLEIEDQE